LPFALLAVVLARLPWRREWLGALWVQLSAMAVAFAIFGLYQYETRDIFWNPKVRVGNAYAPFYRVNSAFWDPSIYGRFLVVAIPSVRHHSLNSASGGRFKLVKNGVAIAAHHPVQGIGIGGFKQAYAKRTGLKGKEPKAAASHDTPVTIAAENGIVGLALFGWLLLTAFMLAFRRVAPATFAGRVSLILGVVLAAIGVHSLFYNAFFEDPMAWSVFGLAPLAAAALARERVSEPVPKASVQQPAVVAAPQAGRSRAEAR